jgi:hypothetical protein
MEQTNRIMSRIQLANHFKQQAFEAIGVNQQRMGQPIAQQTATGVTQAMQQSFSQTEMYFIQHSDHLMPRVHQMRTDLSQYYHSTNPNIRLNYISSEAEKVNFQMNGTDLLLRDFNVFCTTKTNHRAILDQLKQMAMTNNTTGATIYDLGNIVKAESIAEVSDILKEAEAKQQQQQQQQQKQQQDMQSQQLQAQAQEKQAERDFQANENEKERQKDIMVAEIRGASFSGQVDMDQNQQGDFKDAMQDIRKRDEYRDQMNFKREESAQRNATDQAKMGIEREKLATQRDIANKNLEIARENKNKYDVQSKAKDKKK